MKVSAKVEDKTKLDKVKKKTKKAEITSLRHAIQYIRKVAVNSIGKGETKRDDKGNPYRIASQAGERPKTWQNRSRRMMKKGIRYHLSRDRLGRPIAALYAAPQNPGDRIYQMHEVGGSQQVEYTYSRIVGDRSNRRATWEKIKSGEWKVKKMEDRSSSEQKYIRNYYANIKTLVKVKKRGRYRPRPYLMPAVKKCQPMLLEFLRKGIVREYS